MSQPPPPLPLPDAPPPAVTNTVVVLSLLAPPSPLSPASPRRAGAANRFRDAFEKLLLDLALTGYSPVKKKGDRRTRGASISPCDAVLLANDESSNKSNDKDYSPTPIGVRITHPKKRDSKITLDSNFFAFLRPATFHKQMFIPGHHPIYPE